MSKKNNRNLISKIRHDRNLSREERIDEIRKEKGYLIESEDELSDSEISDENNSHPRWETTFFSLLQDKRPAVAHIVAQEPDSDRWHNHNQSQEDSQEKQDSHNDVNSAREMRDIDANRNENISNPVIWQLHALSSMG